MKLVEGMSLDQWVISGWQSSAVARKLMSDNLTASTFAQAETVMKNVDQTPSDQGLGL